jgi:hypothetical protein
MTLTFDTSTPSLEIPEAVHREFWQPQGLTPSHWQTYLNQVCLRTVLPWLEGKFEQQPVIAFPATPGFWELVNGSAFILGRTRLIVLPSEAMDRSEFRVPQEWVDIPDWIGDYYLAVEVDTDEQMVHLWGYTTHTQLKSQGTYGPIDRTYTLNGDKLIQDLAVLWVMQQVAQEPTRAEVPTLPDLSTPIAETLIQQLGRLDVILPRLEIPFQQWGALLRSDRWRQQLCGQRQRQIQPLGLQQGQGIVRLSQWLQSQFESGWQTIEELFRAEPNLAFSLRLGEDDRSAIRRVKQIQLGAELSDVVLAIALEPEPEGKIRIEVQVLPSQGSPYLPAHLQLVMRSTAGETLQSVEAGDQSNYIQLRRFKCSSGATFHLLIGVAGLSVTEDFVV